jgi:hypothetical protein
MMFYEGSVGEKMACLKAGKLPLSDVLRYYYCLSTCVVGLTVILFLFYFCEMRTSSS